MTRAVPVVLVVHPSTLTDRTDELLGCPGEKPSSEEMKPGLQDCGGVHTEEQPGLCEWGLLEAHRLTAPTPSATES